MRKITRNEPCPCDSGQKFKRCCGPALEGAVWPASAEALMRSRYSAFVTGNVEHLWRTCHPDCEMVKGVAPERFRAETLSYCKSVEYTSLAIERTWPEDEQGVARVQFTATYRTGGRENSFTELSQFVRPEAAWLYLRGTSDRST